MRSSKMIIPTQDGWVLRRRTRQFGTIPKKLCEERSPGRQTARVLYPLFCVLRLADSQERVIGCQPIAAVYCLS